MSPLPPPGRLVRSIGFDDAPFVRRRGARVPVAGVVCAGTRFEGLVLGAARQDGWGATDEICRLLLGGKFLPQVHLVLLDGLGFAGLNLVDLEALAARLRRPCVAVMRRRPDLAAMERAERRLSLLRRAGPVHDHPPFAFQVRGAEPGDVAPLLARLTDRGNVPEPL